MDFTAVQQATDNDLNSLGLTKRGDILSLRSLTQRKTVEDSNERTEKRRNYYSWHKRFKHLGKKANMMKVIPPLLQKCTALQNEKLAQESYK